MSHTTDITLLLGILDDREELQEFNGRLKQSGVEFDNDCPRLTSLASALVQLPGSKYFTDNIAAAGWNYGASYADVLVNEFQSFEWKQPENAVLIVAPEGEPSQVYRPRGY